MTISKQESVAISSLRFVCMAFLVLLHTDTSHLAKETLVGKLHDFGGFVQIPFLPILFVLSGYLFFIGVPSLIGGGGGDLRSFFIRKWKKRVTSLLFPYLLWSIISIFYKHYVKGVAWPEDWQWIVWLWDTGSGHPVGMALWYVRNLLLFVLLSPLYYLFVRKMGHFTIVLILVVNYWHFPIDLPWFNIYLLAGSYLAIKGVSFLRLAELLDWRYCFVFFLLLKIGVYCSVPVPAYCSPLCGFCGLMGLLARKPLPTWLVSSSSLIYFLHPYFTGIRNLLVTLIVSESLVLSIGAWLATWAINIVICIGTFFVLKRISPKLLSMMTGGRT